MFNYAEGQIVALKDDMPSLRLKSGDTGRIWALYDIDPPEYEVTFRRADGSDIDLTVSEDELITPPNVRKRKTTAATKVAAA